MLGRLTNEQIEHVLRSEVVGRIGCCAKNDMYIVPVAYVYHKDFIYAHSKEGLKIEMMRKNPNVCFQVDSIENMANWRSVIVWGEYQELKHEKEQKAGMKIIADRILPVLTSETVRRSQGVTQSPAVIEKAFKAIVYRIKIARRSGRYEKTAISEINGMTGEPY